MLDRAHANHPDMVLLHGASSKGAEFISSKWADARKVTQIAFRPDWTRHGKAAPFKRNDQLLQTIPIGLIVFPGSGITENLADKARGLGVPVWRFKCPQRRLSHCCRPATSLLRETVRNSLTLNFLHNTPNRWCSHGKSPRGALISVSTWFRRGNDT